jgi:adenylate cyclase
MATEIEHKFLVVGDGWRREAHASQEFEQGYLCGEGPASVRVRIEGNRANLNIKASVVGMVRAEYEYPIPMEDAREMLANLCVATPVVKTRHWVVYGSHTWEIDEFAGENAPLVVGEIEVDSVDEDFERPPWLGEEVTDDARYYNHALAFTPYAQWNR